jgi:hypothetical protein
MSNYPNSFDDDSTLPVVNDNLTEIGGDAINGLRDAVVQIEQALGLGIAGSAPSLAARLGVFINPDGTPNASVLTSLGLVTLPIRNDQIASNAGILESKLQLDYSTTTLFNYIKSLSLDVNTALGWINVSGVKLEPHLAGAIYRHTLSQIDVSTNGAQFLKNNLRLLRDNTQSYTLINDINNELLAHQWADGSPFGTIHNIITNDGSVYPNNYGHTASGIFVNTSRFTTIPQTADDVQLFAEYIDSTGIFSLGTRIQNLYSNGISKASRSSNLINDGYGQNIIPVTPVISYLKNIGNSSSPFDDINTGDDIIEFKPSAADQSTNSFDEKFALVRVGDIIRINYGTIEVGFVIQEKKYIQSGGTKKYLVRIAGKNLFYSTIAIARIDRPLFNNNKYGELALSPVNNAFASVPSLIVNNPRGAQALGLGFSPDEFDENHYLLYLALYPTGNPNDGYTILPAIDVTGNGGTTPGSYTLDSIVQATNNAFRQPGFNYRFTAFSYKGEFGICLADSYNNASFSILSVVIAPDGTIDTLDTSINFPNNVVDLQPTVGTVAPDPLGFGPFGANVASPPLLTAYGSAAASQNPTRLFVPLKRNNYYVNGAERERLNLQVGQVLDTYGDGYWFAGIQAQLILPGSPGRVQTTYRVPLDLSTSDLKTGKTLVVQSLGQGTLANFGRFIIQNINFGCSPAEFTDITVYDSVHAIGTSPSPVLGTDGYVSLYFNSDSVSFNSESATDFITATPFRRYFEIYTDQNGNTFSHERGRINIGNSTLFINEGVPLRTYSELIKFDLVKISPKLRGYQFGSVDKITLKIVNYDSVTGIFSGFLSSYDGTTFTHQGPLISGKKGEVVRFYDETNIDYIDISFNISTAVSSFSNQAIDLQLFPTLSLDDEVMLIGTCQVNDITQIVNNIRDERQFGNTSEKELSTSALNLIALPEKLLHFNGVVRGFDITNISVTGGVITLNGGVALVDGKINQVNNEIIVIPRVVELGPFPINWLLCVNSIGELVTIPMTDYDPVLGTPNNPNRIFVADNIVSATTYPIDSVLFSNLLNTRKDLTVLYVISAIVTGSGPSSTIALTSRDVRRFVNDQDSSMPAVVSNGLSQGNFQTFDAAANWINLNKNFQNTIQLKGDTLTAVDPKFNTVDSLNNYVNIIGSAHQVSIEFNTNITMSNVKFANLDITFLGTATLTNVDFKNCRVFCTATTSITNGSFKDSSFNNATTTTFTGTLFDNTLVSFSGAPSFINAKLNGGTLTIPSAGATLTNTSISNSTITINGTISASSSSITDSTVQANIAQSFTMGNGFRFERNTVTYSGTPGGGYSSSDLVNSASGFMFATVSTNLSGLTVRDNTFTTAMADRYPFFSVRLTDYAAIVQNVDVSKNTFTSTAATDDLRAVIAIVSTLTSPASIAVSPRLPKLVNVSVDSNKCNYNQMIVITTTRLPATQFNGAMLTVTNTKISNNTCGTIGFITSASSISDFSNAGSPNNGFVRDKEEALLISGNTCKFIANLDAIGDYIAFRSTVFPSSNSEYVLVSTGGFIIEKNIVNWIQVGCSGYDGYANDGGMILNNKIFPDNPLYLNNYIDALTSGLTPGNAAIILRREFNGAGPTNSLIGGNLISQKTITTGLGLSTFYYDVGIACFNNATISNNTITGVINSSTAPMLYLWTTGNVTVTDNTFNRVGLTIQAYVTGQAGASNRITITKNIFDSPFVDAGNTNENVGLNIPALWNFYANKNQTGYASLPIGDIQDLSTTPASRSGGWKPYTDNGGFANSTTKDWFINVSQPLSLYLFGGITQIIPEGVRLLFAVIGVHLESATSTVSSASVFYTMGEDKSAAFSTSSPPTSFAGSNADSVGIASTTGDTSITSNTLNTGNIISSATVTQYMYTDLSSLNWVTGGTNRAFNININGTFTAVTSTMAIGMSPLLIKYRW